MGNIVNKFLYQPPSTKSEQISNLIYLRNKKGGIIYCYYFDRSYKYTILFSHGNAETIHIAMDFIEKNFLKYIKRVNVMVYEYTGYTSTNPDFDETQTLDPCEDMLLADIEAVFEYLVNNMEIPSKNIILYGRSLGCGPSIHIASKYDVGGLIVQSGFTSTYRVILDLRWDLPGDQFLNLNKIKNVDCLIFIIHGTNDEIVPFEHSIDLWKRSKNKVTPLWLKGIGHNNMEIAHKIMFRKIKDFLQIIRQQQQIGN